MSSFFRAILLFLFHIGYFGPLVLGIVTSFIVLPFGNDLLLVGLVAQHPKGLPIYVLSATCGSTIGVFLLALLARKLGEEGICRVAGEQKFEKLKNNIGKRSGLAVAIGSLAPPPFPYTIVMAAASALGYPYWRQSWLRSPGKAALAELWRLPLPTGCSCWKMQSIRSSHPRLARPSCGGMRRNVPWQQKRFGRILKTCFGLGAWTPSFPNPRGVRRMIPKRRLRCSMKLFSIIGAS